MPDLNHGDLSITSPAFDHGEAIPARFSNGGEDVSPALRWSGVPDGTVELVLVVHDPDAPLVDGFTHWVATGIDPSGGGLDEGAGDGLTQGQNTMGDDGYMGPAPPEGHGPHHYFFHLFAVDTALDDPRPSTREEVLERIDGHIIEQARLVGTFEA